MTQGIEAYLDTYKNLSPSAQKHLAQLAERYPYFHVARMLYLRSLYHNHDTQFGSELRNAALRVPSRAALYQLIEGDRLNPAKMAAKGRRPQRRNTEEDRTNSLIGDFLNAMPEEKPRSRKVDATVDYMEFLRQKEADSEVFGHPATPAQPAEDTPLHDVIGDFLSGDGRLVIHDRSDEEMLKPLQDQEESQDSAVLTEMMARIYVKQRKFDQALEIIQKLSLKYPKKNRYFADQIRFLEKLIKNNENK